MAEMASILWIDAREDLNIASGEQLIIRMNLMLLICSYVWLCSKEIKGG